MIKALLFDLGNVLLYFSHAKMRTQMAEVSGLSVGDVGRLLDVDRRQWRYEAGEISTAEFVEIFRKASGRAFSRAALLEAASDIFTAHDEMLPVLTKLKAKGHRLVVVSNTNEAHMDFAAGRFACFKLFDEFIYSYAVKAMKPAPEFYAAAQRAAGCPPAACLFTDDLQENVDGAKGFGFQAVLFTTAPAFVKALPTFGITL